MGAVDHRDAIRMPGGKWHRGGRYDYPGEVHCPTGLGLVLMPRNCERAWSDEVPRDQLCRRCFGRPAESAPRTGQRCICRPTGPCVGTGRPDDECDACAELLPDAQCLADESPNWEGRR